MAAHTLGRNTVKQEPIFSRPQTAHLHSIKRLAEVLEGKYMSMQNRLPANLLPPKSSEDRRRQQVASQAQPRMTKRKRNSSIENCKAGK